MLFSAQGLGLVGIRWFFYPSYDTWWFSLSIIIRVNFDLYCQDKAAPAGMPADYALRAAAAAHRPLLTALFAFRRELEDTVEYCSELSVGLAKLSWWQAEIESLKSAATLDPVFKRGPKPTHPVALALSAYLPSPTAAVAALQAIAQGYKSDLEQERYWDFRDLSIYLDQTSGQFATLIARLCGIEEGAACGAAGRLGQALGLAHIACEVGHHARRGRIYIPVDEMQHFGVTAADIISRRYSDAFAALMAFQIERARAGIGEALAGLRHLRRRLRAVLEVQAALALATLAEIEADNYSVLHQRISLTPLRLAWLAWRAGR
jgi:phytoene synthase